MRILGDAALKNSALNGVSRSVGILEGKVLPNVLGK